MPWPKGRSRVMPSGMPSERPRGRPRKVKNPRLIDVLPLLMKMVPVIRLERIERVYPVFKDKTICLKRDRISSQKAARSVKQRISTNEKVTRNKVPTNKKVRTNNKVPTDEKVTTNKVPTNEKVTTNKVPTNEKVRTNQVPTNEKITANNKVPTNEKVTTNEKVPTNDKAPTNEKVTTTEKVPINDRVEINNKATINNKVPTNYELPTKDKVATNYKVTSRYKPVPNYNVAPYCKPATNYKLAANYRTVTVNNDDDDDDVNNDALLEYEVDLENLAQGVRIKTEIIKDNEQDTVVVNLVPETRALTVDQQEEPKQEEEPAVSAFTLPRITSVQSCEDVDMESDTSNNGEEQYVDSNTKESAENEDSDDDIMVLLDVKKHRLDDEDEEAEEKKKKKKLVVTEPQPISVEQESEKSTECMSILSTSWALADCMSSNSVVQPTEEVEVIDCIDEDNSDLNKHVNYPCTKCNNSFDTQYAFTAHACCKSELNKGLDGFLCPWCEKRFLDLKVLREHVKICWKGMLTCVICSVTICGKLGIIKHLQEHKKKSPESPTRDTACLVCGLFDEKWNVIEHWRAHTGVNLLQCVVCKQNLDIETLPSHLNMHRRNDPGCGDLNWCHSCGLTFRNKAAYLNHRNGHSTRKFSHLCESCGLFFESFDDLEQHMLYHVDQNTVYKCTKCNKIYPFWAHFEIHCKVCFRMGEMNSTTDAAQALLRSIREKYLKVFNTHMLDLIRYAIKKDIKSGRRVPVMQSKVPQVNNSSGNMLMKLRKEDSTVLLYSCQACRMRLVGKESFMRHWREHTGYDPNKCVICSETFAIPKLLEIHMSIAHASCFKCTSCAMVFKTSLERKYHSAAHNGKNSYFCEICGAGFEEFNYLEYHVFTNHVKDCEIRSYQLGTRSGPTANRSTSTQSTANAIVGGPSNVLQLPGSSGATVANFSTTIASGSAVNLQLPGTSNPHINALMKQVTNVPSAFAKVATPVSHAVPTPAATLDVQQQTSKATSPRVNVCDLYMCTVCKVVSPDLPTMVAHARSHKT